MKQPKKKRKPPVNPCPKCGGETTCSVIYTDGAETRRCEKRRCRAVITRYRQEVPLAA